MTATMRLHVSLGLLILAGTAVLAKEPAALPVGGPFALGEAYAAKPATCETAKDWIGRAPETDDRISFSIIGRIAEIHWDGALAYLIVCQQPDVQVMCVTYSKDGRSIGETVLLGGGFQRVGEKRIRLDPCLASHRVPSN